MFNNNPHFNTQISCDHAICFHIHTTYPVNEERILPNLEAHQVDANRLRGLLDRVNQPGNHERENHRHGRRRAREEQQDDHQAEPRFIMRLVDSYRDATLLNNVRNLAFGRLNAYAFQEFLGHGRFYNFLGGSQATLIRGLGPDGTAIRVTTLGDNRTMTITNLAGRYLRLNENNTISFEASAGPNKDNRVSWVPFCDNASATPGGTAIQNVLTNQYLAFVLEEEDLNNPIRREGTYNNNEASHED